MPVNRKWALALAAVAAMTSASASAEAQSLSPYGIWDEPSTVSRPAQRPQQSGASGGYNSGAYGESNIFGSYSEPRAPKAVWSPADPSQPMVADGGGRPDIEPVAPDRVTFQSAYEAGVIVIDTGSRRLYRVNGDGTAFAYPIGVGREGFAWRGEEKVSRVAEWPDWYPPAEMRQRRPELPEKMLGGLLNPLGARAIYLGTSLYRIHGTDAPKTVGRAELSGCIRMLNEHVVHLVSLVSVGTRVIVTPALDPSIIVAEAASTYVR